MNKLVQEIIKPLLEDDSKITKIVGIYGGRFQPFGPHHYKTYKWLTKYVDDAYITTSNIKKPPRHPMNFKEKVRHMSKMGVPSNRIIEEKSPYVAKNLAKKYDKDTTAFVYIFGAKDAGRLGGGGKYFQDYKKNKKNLKGFEEHGYYLVAPHVSISVGGKEVSGTTMRELLGSDKFDDKERVKLFKKMFGYYDKGVFNMMTNKFKKLFEDVDMEFKPQSMYYIPSKKRPLKKKWKDGKGKELLGDMNFKKALKKVKIPNKLLKPVNKQKLINYLTSNPQLVTQLIRLATEDINEDWFKKGSKKDRALKLKISKLYSKAFKMVSNSKEQLKVRKEIEKLRNQLSEDIKLPINIGDTVMMGRFKNKKVVIKSIDYNNNGDLLINGRPALKFRIVKSKEIDEFLIHTDISKIIKEISSTANALDADDEEGSFGLQAVDSGPSAFMGGMGGYAGRNNISAQKLGWNVMNYILKVDVPNVPPTEDELNDLGWPVGPHQSVSYFPAGIGTGVTPNNQENLTGDKAYKKWLTSMNSVATEVGMELLNFMDDKQKALRKQVRKDSKATIKQQEKEEVVESVFTKDWWGDLITEDWWSDMSSQEQDDYIKKHPASQKARQRKDKEEKKSRKKKVKNLPGIDKPIDKNSPKAKGAQTKGPKTDDDAIGTDAEKERIIIRGIQQLVHSGNDVDLCKISVPGTNLFCDDNKGVPRKEMPQFKSKPMKGSKAEELVNKGILKVDKNGEVDTEDIFLKHIGKEAKSEKVKVTDLKATQNQIVGNKVSLFLNQLQNGDEDSEFTKALKEPIIVSSDGYIIDGHHRWAALVALDIANGGDGDIEMDIKRVDEPVESLLKKSNDFTNQMGLETKSGGKEKKEEVFTKDWWKEQLLTEGGAYGHMAHPFDDKDLTFGDLKQIITNGLGGNLNREDNVTEKLDGQNIMVSWKDGKLIAARNKGHIKNGGKTALTTSGISSKFKGRGDIADAFNFAMKDLERAIKGLSQKQKDKIFNNGYNFMNLEVMWPKSANVIDYDKAELVFHGALQYDDSGTVIGEVPGSGRILAGMIKQVNMHIGKKYKIGKPVFLTVPKHQDFGKMKGKFLGRLTRLQSKFGLKNNDTLALYHQKWWEQFITKQLKKVSPKVLKGLVKRWAFFDKSYKIPQIKQDLKDEPIFLEWVLKTDKENHAKIVKENMKPFEILFFAVGAEILKNVQGFMAANPDKAVQGIRKRLDSAIKNVQKGGDLKKLNTLKLQLDKLNSIGGTKSIVPSEGIVFKYKGKTYKFTGAFAPVNQITGLISF